MGKVIGSASECSGNDDGGLDTPTRQLAGIDHRQGVHAGLRREVWSKIRWCSSGRAAAGYPHHRTVLLLLQLRQRSTVHPLSAEHIDVVELCELFGRESFRGTENHVTSVVDHNVQVTVVAH